MLEDIFADERFEELYHALRSEVPALRRIVTYRDTSLIILEGEGYSAAVPFNEDSLLLANGSSIVRRVLVKRLQAIVSESERRAKGNEEGIGWGKVYWGEIETDADDWSDAIRYSFTEAQADDDSLDDLDGSSGWIVGSNGGLYTLAHATMIHLIPEDSQNRHLSIRLTYEDGEYVTLAEHVSPDVGQEILRDISRLLSAIRPNYPVS